MTLHQTLREDASSPSAAPPQMTPAPVPGIGWRNRMARVFAGRTATELVETESLLTEEQPEAWQRIVFCEEAPAPLRWPLRALDGWPRSGGCRVTLATHYESRMHPRWLWQPLEKHFLTQLHRHILASMQTQNKRTCERQESRA